MMLAYAILAALLHRERTEKGRKWTSPCLAVSFPYRWWRPLGPCISTPRCFPSRPAAGSAATCAAAMTTGSLSAT